MTNKTHILGKDAALEDSIEKMKNLLKLWEFEIEETSWLNPVENVWSVHIRDKQCPFLFTNGKGVSKLACLASALGEFLERLNCNYFFADYYLGEKFAKDEFVHYPQEKWFKKNQFEQILNPKLKNLYHLDDDNLSTLIDTNSGARDRGVVCVPYTNLIDQKQIWFPVNLIGNLYVSNGMSAGNSKCEAQVQAMSEIFERYVKFEILKNNLTLPIVPSSFLEKFPKIITAIKALETHGYPIEVRDASLGGKFPVINVTLLNPTNATVFASFGAHPKFEVALERTLTELLQGRSLDQLNVFSPPTFDQEAVENPLNLEAHFIDSNGFIHWDFFQNQSSFDFVAWNIEGKTQDEHEAMLSIFKQMDKDVFVMDYDHLGIYGCRMIVPTMSEIYPLEDLIDENNNQFIHLRSPILNIHQTNSKQALDLLNLMDEENIDDMLLVTQALGILPDPNTSWACERIGDLKVYLSLKAQDFERAKQNIDWCLHFSPLDQETKNLFSALNLMLEMKSSNQFPYQDSFMKLYPPKIIERATKLLKGENCFEHLFKTNDELNGFMNHQKLLNAYEKLKKAKLKWQKQNS